MYYVSKVEAKDAAKYPALQGVPHSKEPPVLTSTVEQPWARQLKQ